MPSGGETIAQNGYRMMAFNHKLQGKSKKYAMTRHAVTTRQSLVYIISLAIVVYRFNIFVCAGTF